MVLLLSTAWAGECQPLFEVEMVRLLDASDGILASPEPDMRAHAGLTDQLEKRLTCSAFLIGTELWSRYLVGVAIREYPDGDWTTPLTTALRANAGVDIPMREGHPLREWDPTPQPAPVGPLPEGVVLYADGREVEVVPTLDAVHLLQRPWEEGYQTLVVTGGEVPKTWLRPPRAPQAERQARRRKAIHTWGSVGSGALLAGGAASLAVGLQARSAFFDERTPEDELPTLESRNDKMMPLALTLLGVGGTGLAATWTIPW